MSEITTTTYTPKEIKAFARADLYLAIPGTVVSGQNLTEGTVLGKITASNKLKAYNDANVDGSEVAVGIISSNTNATAGDKVCTYFIKGAFYTDQLIGVDDAAKADLGAREPADNLFIF